MTLIKSLLLGSAAGIVAVASAQAADLPTRKGPVAAEYVRVCSITVAGAPVVGFVLPGSDTCFKFSGFATAQIEGGNIYQNYSVDYTQHGSGQAINGFNAATGKSNNVFGRDSLGYSTRFNLTMDAVSNTAYGPLVSHAEYQFNHSEGFDQLGTGGSDGGLNRAYITWAGLTAGKANSFFAFTGGGLGYANFFSPDRQGFNQPDLFAYTASFGGGFAATISLESASSSFSGPIEYSSGSNYGLLGTGTFGGSRYPDIVGALSVHQAWGMAQVSGMAHNVRAISNDGESTLDKWGYAVDAGVQFNIPGMTGSMVGFTGAFSQNAILASGLPDGMWDGFPNDNGQDMPLGDAAYNGPNAAGGPGTWATPNAYSITGYAQFAVGPTVTLGVEGSFGGLQWTNTSAFSMLSDSQAYLVGGVAHYDPVKNLDFEVELLYEDTKTDKPAGYIPGAVAGPGFTNTWHGNADGFATRFMVSRSF